MCGEWFEGSGDIEGKGSGGEVFDADLRGEVLDDGVESGLEFWVFVGIEVGEGSAGVAIDAEIGVHGDCAEEGDSEAVCGLFGAAAAEDVMFGA